MHRLPRQNGPALRRPLSRRRWRHGWESRSARPLRQRPGRPNRQSTAWLLRPRGSSRKTNTELVCRTSREFLVGRGVSRLQQDRADAIDDAGDSAVAIFDLHDTGLDRARMRRIDFTRVETPVRLLPQPICVSATNHDSMTRGSEKVGHGAAKPIPFRPTRSRSTSLYVRPCDNPRGANELLGVTRPLKAKGDRRCRGSLILCSGIELNRADIGCQFGRIALERLTTSASAMDTT